MKAPNHRNTADPTGWARRVNARWIAHHGLSDNARAYLDHLGRCDPDRLTRSCRRAHRLVRACEPGEDPKPWFYAGVFSLATEPEVRQFLAGHWFTRAAVLSSVRAQGPLSGPDDVGADTREKLDRIRKALRCLVEDD